MCLLVDFLETADRKMSVNLSGGKVGVTEEVLDNTEILFSPELQQYPLRLLQMLSRNRTVVAAWAGKQEGESLTYADPAHPEFKRYPKPDAVIVPTVEAQDEAEFSAQRAPLTHRLRDRDYPYPEVIN